MNFITTCLSINEINHLTLEPCRSSITFHYGDTFTKPQRPHWMPAQWRGNTMNVAKEDPFKSERQYSSPATNGKMKQFRHFVGRHIKDVTVKNGHGPGFANCIWIISPAPA